jgi:putative CocE/NonD family hydrolase
MPRKVHWLGLVLLVFVPSSFAQETVDLPKYIRENYVRQDHRIAVRDGVRLYTVTFSPKDTSRTYPILMLRTPYGVGPYEQDKFRGSLGPNSLFIKEGYIFVYQDVRGRFMSEGEFENMRPQRGQPTADKNIDESTDTYDSIDWLVNNVPNNNGKVGQWGISYPGFYTAVGMVNAHPALKAVSPQAPIADWFFDDFNHHGAFFLTHAFNFFYGFGQPRPKPTPQDRPRFQHGTPDGYQFFMNIGPLKNADPRYLKGRVAYWNRFIEHPNYDSFWQDRNLLPHLKKVAPAVMTVGGWFDAEDLYGPLKIYRAVEKQNPGIFNVLVMGPWAHGAWSSADGSRLGNIQFGAKTSKFFQENMELPFFNHFLKGTGQHGLPEAYMFETGVNRWRKFNHWPPKLQTGKLYARAGARLSFDSPTEEEGCDEYISDPDRPVPYTEEMTTGMSQAYMTDDQRFASRRPDVAVYQTPPLKKDLTLAGPLHADLFVSTSGTDSDWIVKVIDVFPDEVKYPDPPSGRKMGGYQMMVRSEVIRGRFRKSYSHPEAFVPNQPARVSLELLDVLHTFQKGHRIMVQIHSSWFPLVDRNPQTYVPNIFLAEERDFVKTTQRVYRTSRLPTSIQVGILPEQTDK